MALSQYLPSYGPSAAEMLPLLQVPRFAGTSVYHSGYELEGPEFECRLQCMRCQFHDAEGQQCKRTTCLSLPYCAEHLERLYKLRVGQTTLVDARNVRFPFLGLFACDTSKPEQAVVFRPLQRIIPYFAERISQKERGRRYKTKGPASHAIEDSMKKVWDAACVRGAAANANTALLQDGQPDGARINAFIADNQAGGLLVLVADRAISNGDEIFVYYGEHYHFGNAYTEYAEVAEEFTSQCRFQPTVRLTVRRPTKD